VHGVEDAYSDLVNFVYLDIDDDRTGDFKKVLGYRYQPHIFLLDENGEVLEQWSGPVNIEQLESAILKALD
jgi:hypothetical protein